MNTNKYIAEMKSQEGLQALFEHSNEGILITDNKGTITRVNPSCERMFGYGKDELVGQKIEILIPRELAGKHIEHRKVFSNNPHSRSMGIGMNLFGRRKDDTEFPVEVSLSPYTSQSDSHVIAFIIDITVRKAVEDEITRKKQELEELTVELKQSNAELENFAYISSHDLQEPLRKIQSFGDRLKTLEGDKFSEKGRDYLDRMMNASERMQILINDLLTFSRLSSRAQAFQPVNLTYVLEGVLSDLEVSIEKSGTTIHADELPVIEAESTQMRQLFQNLISNAIKFRHEEKTPVITIGCEKKKNRKKEWIELTFADNGIGFDEKYADKIFNIFQRLEGKKYEGSGIGLSICKKIATLHGGNITVKSSPGNGTTFTVTLNVKDEKKSKP